MTSGPIRFEILHRSPDAGARVGRVTTPHGSFDTPAFMPVGTRGSVKGVLPQQVADTGAQILLNNTYHLLLRPGPELVARRGGVHRFMGWPHPILTDSGGYQAYSLAAMNRIDDDGVTFKSIVDGSEIRLTPERAIEVQSALGADIIMAFDDCPPSIDPALQAPEQERLAHAAARDRIVSPGKRSRTYDHAARLAVANERTVRWLERCKRAHTRSDQALFGIVQGGTDLDRRTWSAERICAIELPGYAIGGVAVGESGDQIARVVRHTAPLLPEAKPRYLMGVGYERDILCAVRAGIDMFDCVLPTRNGRNANAFTRAGQVRLRNQRFAEDDMPIEPGCDCYACDPARHGWPLPARPAGPGEHSVRSGVFTRAYIRHLFMAGEMLGPMLVSIHNLRHFQRFMADIRHSIPTGDWSGLLGRWPVARENPGEQPPSS